ncbi:MAG: DUF3168 domain-containing protein [Pseudomonadota bacterium]
MLFDPELFEEQLFQDTPTPTGPPQFEEALVARLRAATAITSLVGTYNNRPAIDWVERPEALPAITLQGFAPGRIYNFDGPRSLEEPVVQIDCWGESYGVTKLIERAVIAELEQQATVSGVAFQNGFLADARAMNPEDLASGTKVFRQSLDFRLFFTPA